MCGVGVKEGGKAAPKQAVQGGELPGHVKDAGQDGAELKAAAARPERPHSIDIPGRTYTSDSTTYVCNASVAVHFVVHVRRACVRVCVPLWFAAITSEVTMYARHVTSCTFPCRLQQ